MKGEIKRKGKDGTTAGVVLTEAEMLNVLNTENTDVVELFLESVEAGNLQWFREHIAHRHMTKAMLIAMAVCVPIGNLLLFAMEPNLIRRIIGWLIVGASVLILSGWRYRGPQGVGASAITGVISGLINGFVGLGGPPLVIYMLALKQTAAVQRANILVFMAITSVLILGSTFVSGGVTTEAGILGVLTAPFLWIGGWLGARLFLTLPAELFKKFSLVALIVLGGIVAFL